MRAKRADNGRRDSARDGLGHLLQDRYMGEVESRIALRASALGEPEQVAHQQRREGREEPPLPRPRYHSNNQPKTPAPQNTAATE